MSTQTTLPVAAHRMACPVEGCTVSGSVAGIRRHVAKKHVSNRAKRNALVNEALKASGDVAAISVYSVTGPASKDRRAAEKAKRELSTAKAEDLRKKAKDAGVKGWHKMTKADLVKALLVIK